jgi:hypothetical protein
MERGTFKDPKFVQALNDVCVPLVMPTSWKDFPSVDVKVGDKVEKRYKDYPRLTVDEAKGIMGSAETTVPYGKEFESWVTPVYVIGNSKKELLVKTLDRKVINTARIFQDIQAAQTKLGGKGANQATYRPLLKAIQALDQDKFGEALKALADLEKVKGLVDSIKKEIGTLREKIAAKGEEKLASTESKEELQKLADQFKGHPFESKILEKLK